MELCFEENLWGQYDLLHERLIKKINYYENIHKMFDSIHISFQNIMKKLNQMNITIDSTIFPNIQSSEELNKNDSNKKDSEYYGFPLIMKIMKDYFKEAIDFNDQTLENILNNITSLIDTMNKEKNEYDKYLKSLNSYLEKKNVMEQNMKIYFQKAKAAEQSVCDLKKLELKYSKINKDENLLININKIKESSIQLVNNSFKYYKIYKESLIKANEAREESIKLEKLLLNKFQNIEKETGKINISLAFIISSNQNIQKEIADNKLKEMEEAKKTLNPKKEIKQLIIDYSGNYRPFDELKIKHFDSIIDFDKPDNDEEYQIFLQTVLFIKEINNEEYPNFNEDLENIKNEMRNLIYKLFSKYNEEDADKLKKCINNHSTHSLFLIILSKLRTRNSSLDIQLIDLLGIILNEILDDSEKNNNYNNAKNCIILSQTFYYENENKEKIYLFLKIQNNKWVLSADFWENFIDIMINNEIKKFFEFYPELKKDIFEDNSNTDKKTKMRLSEILFTQLVPYVNNMIQFQLDKSIILRITDFFCNKYKALNESHSESLYSLISNNKEEIKELREKYQNEKK